MKQSLIYIIEDSPFVQDLIEFSLTLELNCRVQKFTGVEAAITAIKQERPDVVILDYALDASCSSAPNGLAFFEALATLKLKVPTVVFSGQKSKTLAVKLLKKGAVDYISKNEDNFLEMLLAAIDRILKLIALNQKVCEQQLKKIQFLRNACFILGGAVSAISLICYLN